MWLIKTMVGLTDSALIPRLKLAPNRTVPDSRCDVSDSNFSISPIIARPCLSLTIQICAIGGGYDAPIELGMAFGMFQISAHSR